MSYAIFCCVGPKVAVPFAVFRLSSDERSRFRLLARRERGQDASKFNDTYKMLYEEETMKSTLKVLAGAGLVMGSMAVGAATITETDVINIQTTNWVESLNINQFNNAGGTLILDSVELKLTTDVTGFAKIESLDAAPAVITTNWGGAVTVDLTSLSIADMVGTAGLVFTDNASIADGIVDFGGTSGFSHLDLSDSDVLTVTTTNVGDLAFFTGAGSVSFSTAGDGASTATGAGNVVSQFSTSAGATLEVKYTFHDNTPPAVPVPAPLALMGLGLLGLAFRRK